MFKELKTEEKELLQKVEDIMNDFVIPKQFKGEHIRKAFDDFYEKVKIEKKIT